MFNEIGHLPAGVCHWQYRMFHLYRVNPPLPRMVGAFPLLAYGCHTDWGNYDMGPFSREEVPMGIRFTVANGEDVFCLFSIARMACIPFSVAGAWVCYRWAAALWCGASGLVACLLWCMSPAILGNGALVMPDVPAAATGLMAAYSFWRWQQEPTVPRACLAGTMLGVAQLCKTTLLVLFIVLPLIWLLSRAPRVVRCGCRQILREGTHVFAVIAISVFVLNLGYGFTGSFQTLGNFQFLSRLLSGYADGTPAIPGNRFHGTLLGEVPVPVPADYLQGIDRQRADFELGTRSYLRGEWRGRGWWYYYSYCLAIKTPLGTVTLFLLAASMMVRKGYVLRWYDELAILSPAVVMFVVVSSQTGVNIHSRYVIPVLPFAFVWASRVGRCVELQHRNLIVAVVGALSWSVADGLWYYPHSLSYFNQLVGGGRNGHNHLLDSNVAWGQDLLFLRDWLEAHPQAQPLGMAAYGWVHPELAGIRFALPPPGPHRANDARGCTNQAMMGPRPGWYAIDVNFLHGTHWPAASSGHRWTDIPADGLNYEYFRWFKPVATAGYSIYIYHITLEDANRVRRELGLKEL